MTRSGTGTPNDGVLSFRYRQAFPAFTPAGVHEFSAFVADKAGFVASSPPVAVTLTSFSDITIDPTPVSLDGAPLAGELWGMWSAQPGASDVASTNYLRLVNTGDLAAPRIVVDLADAFVGTTDPSFSIPVATNVQFAWFEDLTPATSAPREGAFTFAPANAEGSVTVSFTGKGSIVYVAYRIVELPDVLPAQDYGISFTVTEL